MAFRFKFKNFLFVPILIIFFIFYLIHPFSVLAADEFETDYAITYTVNLDASVLVEQNMVLRNKLANIYATEYQINIGSTQISNVKAWDGEGNIVPEVEKGDNYSAIKLKFNQEVVGKNEALRFGISYLSNDYAQLKGQVLEVGIPRIIDVQELKSYQVVLRVPVSFESPIIILPAPKRSVQENSFNVYSFTQKELADKSIIAFFGQSQIFDFSLTYHLENTENEPLYFEIAFPPDTPFQKTYYTTITPLPENIIVDPDGNWLGKYLVPAGVNLEVVAGGTAEIFLEPKTEVEKQVIGNFEDYLQELEYWQVNDPEIQKLAQDLSTVEKIYDYVVESLSYDYSRVEKGAERMGALKALNNKDQAVCMEFTDLFIALARAAGIPAREVNGYAYTTNPKLRPLSLTRDILHAWPEYYDQEKELWLAVDPTWENTAGIDFFSQSSLNHFSFVFHGLESTYPYSPGSYKSGLEETKDVEVSFGQQPTAKQDFKLSLDFPNQVLGGMEIKGKVKVANLGNVALYEKGFDPIPPFAYLEKEIVLEKTGVFDKGIVKAEFEYKGKKEAVEVEVVSPLASYIIPYGGGLILGFLLFMLLLKLSNNIAFRLRKRRLR